MTSVCGTPGRVSGRFICGRMTIGSAMPITPFTVPPKEDGSDAAVIGARFVAPLTLYWPIVVENAASTCATVPFTAMYARLTGSSVTVSPWLVRCAFTAA